MKLQLLRYCHGPEATLGLLLINGRFHCYALEDESREVKVPGETRIPAGSYRITLRTVGGFHARYARKFPDFHQGMLWLRDVPGFQFILIHIGNSDDDTAGCILIGDQANNALVDDGFVASSAQAYRRIYPIIASAIERSETVTIEVTDEVGR